jgi:hypothetical protein
MGEKLEDELSVLNSQWKNTGQATKAGVTNQTPRGGKLASSKVGQQATLPKWSKWWVPEVISWDRGSIQNWIAPPCWQSSWPNRDETEGQCSCCLVKTTALPTLYELSNSFCLPVETSLVDRKNQILLTSQSPGETTSEFLLIHQYQDWTPKE